MKALIKEYEKGSYYNKDYLNTHKTETLAHKMLKQDIEFCYEDYFSSKAVNRSHLNEARVFEGSMFEDYVLYEDWLESEFLK